MVDETSAGKAGSATGRGAPNAAGRPSGVAGRALVIRTLAVLFAAAFAALLLLRLGHPLVWQDEGETVMLGQRVLEYGYPKAFDGRNLVYGLGVPLEAGIKPESGLYIGSLPGQYYFAALGVWLARGVEDLNARTALLRLPFALAGALGLALGLIAVAPALRSAPIVGGRGALPPAWAVALYAFLLCQSISLVLHTREARYYALVTALLPCIVGLGLRGPATGPDGGGAEVRPRSRGLLLTALLWVLFHVFYPAAVATMLWLALEAAIEWRRQSPARSIARALRRLTPALLAALLVLPSVFYFELPALSSLFTRRYDFGWPDYLANLGAVAHYLLRYELLALALALWLVRLLGRGGGGPGASALLRFVLLYCLIGARNPIFFERYFVALSPILALAVTLEVHALLVGPRSCASSDGPSSGATTRRVAVAVLAVGLASGLWLRSPELSGRVAELRIPYRGPLDFAIPHLRSTYPDPSALTIATNYEAEAYMYYLGSRVVGRFHAQTEQAAAEELAVRVDVVIPRRAQPRNLARVRSYLSQGDFERESLPVEDVAYNNIPELFAGRVLQTTHRFVTPVAQGGVGALTIYHRPRAEHP